MAEVAQQQVPLDTIPISPEGGISNGAPDHTSIPYTNSGEPITVFHDPNNFNVKHPLMNKWTLWFTKPPTGKVSILHVERVAFGFAYSTAPLEFPETLG
jgi:translation initiation factor 4E